MTYFYAEFASPPTFNRPTLGLGASLTLTTFLTCREYASTEITYNIQHK